jgi:hypothetical protein
VAVSLKLDGKPQIHRSVVDPVQNPDGVWTCLARDGFVLLAG